ncbi:MAG: N(2)-fixation sustaining protein CowN [Rhodovulum sp.]
MNDVTLDRYVSFQGIDCDGNADRLMDILSRQMTDAESPWVEYFDRKLAEKQRMGADNLHFIGSQMNTLSAFFEELGDAEALKLLSHLEETCC